MDRLRRKVVNRVSNPNKHLLDFSRYDAKVHRSTPYSPNMVCWNCCHTFSCHPVSIPTRVGLDGHYSTFGNFCGFPCASRYLRPEAPDRQLDYKLANCESPELLEIMYRDFTGRTDSIQTAPPRLTLQYFGGYLTIEEYRGPSSETAPDRVTNYGYTISQTLL